MTLDEYLKEHRIRVADFARRIDRTVTTVSRLRNGHNSPDWETMRKIHTVTGGAVTPNDFLPPAE
jgi:transcriptional regulator with XRE-family HTH domain